MTISAIIFRLRKHADYQRVYQGSRKQFAKQMTYFFTLRPQLGPMAHLCVTRMLGVPALGSPLAR